MTSKRHRDNVDTLLVINGSEDVAEAVERTLPENIMVVGYFAALYGRGFDTILFVQPPEGHPDINRINRWYNESVRCRLRNSIAKLYFI